MKKKKIGMIVTVILILLAFAAGAAVGLREKRLAEQRALEEAQALEEARQRELSSVESYTGALDADGLKGLDQYPNLRELDLSGSTDLAAVMDYIQTHPQVRVRYTVDLGGTVLDNGTESVELPRGSFDYALLRERIRYLPALREILLPETDLEPAQIRQLREERPEISLRYTVSVLEQTVPEDVRELDLSALQAERLEETIRALGLLPCLERATLTGEDGSNALTLEELHTLQTAAPDTLFVYRFQLFGREVSTEEERIEYVRVPIGNEGLPELRRALPCLRRCRYLLLDDCGIDDEELAALRAEWPETKIVWRVHISYLNFLTDIKVIHLTFLLTNSNAQVMRFCNEVEYLDIGHNSISDISFMGYMPHLKYIILSYNKVSDLSPLANCKELEMLELYQCLSLEDISPLAACESLQLLNVSWTGVQDIRPVFGLKDLQRFYCIWNYGIPEEQMEQIYEELPDCWITFEQEHSKNVGWSFDADGGVRAQWYLDMYKIFRYRVVHWFFGDYPEGWAQEGSESDGNA